MKQIFRRLIDSNWFYGIALGILLVGFEVLNSRTILRQTSIELFGVITGGLFLIIGIGVGLLIFRRKSPQHVLKSKPNNLLSEREMEVLIAMAQGHSNQEIADRLFVSLNTIKTHISRIYFKLHVKRRTQAVQVAKSMGFITES